MQLASDESGRFQLAGVPIGTHSIGIALPDGLGIDGQIVTLTSERGGVIGAAAYAKTGHAIFLPLITLP